MKERSRRPMFPDSMETEVTASPTLTVASLDSSFEIIMRLAYPSSEQLVRKSIIIFHNDKISRN
jgi:hypothetical protein